MFCRILIVIDYRSFLFLDSQNPIMKAKQFFETSVTLHQSAKRKIAKVLNI